VDAEDNDVTFHLPSPRLSSYALNYNFKTSVPMPKFWGHQEEQPEDEDSTPGSKEAEEPEPLDVTIQTGIAGVLKCPTQKFTLTHEDDSEEERIVSIDALSRFNRH
jgi:DnaJ family protein C protein 11